MAKRTQRRLLLRRRLRVAGYTCLVLLVISIALDRAGAVGGKGNDWANFDRRMVSVVRVIDAQTLSVRVDDSPSELSVRLIGVASPQPHAAAANGNQDWAERAKAYLTARTGAEPITLRLEPTQTRDSLGQLLAYIYLSDSDCLNLDVIRDGQAFADRRFRHSFRAQFEAAENEARKKSRGLWQNAAEDQMPEWRREWFGGR